MNVYNNRQYGYGPTRSHDRVDAMVLVSTGLQNMLPVRTDLESLAQWRLVALLAVALPMAMSIVLSLLD
jgi:hypothetical protein